MLTKSRIDELIRLKEISISYSFGIENGRWSQFVNEEFVDPDKPDAPANKILAQNFFGDRLTVTLGPVVKTHSRHWPSNRANFKNRGGYFDLREKNLILQPYEAISVATNERIILKGRVAAITIPRLTNVDAGLLYIPSYIDPYWDGILQAVIYNMTNRRQELSLGERIAICRFYCTDGIASESDARRFAAKSHHYGQSWPKILNEDVDPFPRRKSPVQETAVQQMGNSVRQLWRQYGGLIKGIGFAGGFLAVAYGVGVAWTNLNRDVTDKISQAEQDIAQMRNTDLTAISNQVSGLSVRLPDFGVVSARFQRGETETKVTFPISRPQLGRATVWVQLDSTAPQVVEVTGSFDLLPGKSDAGNISIDLRRQTADNDLTVRVKWLLLID